MNKTFNDIEDLLDYAYDFLTDYQDCLFLTEYLSALSLAERLEEENDNIHIIDEVKEGEADTIVYIQNLGKGVYLIQDFFDEDGDIIEEDAIGDDFVLVQKGLLLDEIVDEYIAFNEEIETVELIGNKYENKNIEPCICCEGCTQECCQCEDGEEESYYDILTDAQKEYIDSALEEDFGDDKGYFREKLSEIVVFAFNDGKESTLLTLRDGIDDILED